MVRKKAEGPKKARAVGNGSAAPRSPEAKAEQLEQMFQRGLQQLGKMDAGAQQVLYEGLRLQVEYPNEYVIYRDAWKGRGKNRTFVRTVLGHAPSFEGIWPLIDQYHRECDPDVHMLFVQDPNDNTVYL